MVSASPKIAKANRKAEKAFSLTSAIKLLPTPEQSELPDLTLTTMNNTKDAIKWASVNENNEIITNTIFNFDCLEYMKSLPDNCIDLIVTSPPYAEQRTNTYGGIKEGEYPEWMSTIAKEIYRVLKPTGSFVLNIKENANDGVRSTYVIKTVLLLSETLLWSDTFIWNKSNPFPTGSKKRLKDGFEYCYFFTKTKNYKFYPSNVLVKSQSKWLESEKKRKNKGSHKVTNGSGMNMSKRYSSEMVRPSNVITIPTDSTNHKHPATFPLSLPTFFIKLLSDEGDIVYDPFAGSGTTLKAAKDLNRQYVGTEIMEEYIDIIMERLQSE